MAKFLAELLEAKQPLFSISLAQLEEISGKPSVDVKLIAEIERVFNEKVRALGLDPQDASGEEIYQALLNLAKVHDAQLAKTIGAKDAENVEEVRECAVKAIEALDMPKSCWALKDEVARDMLINQPPENIMARLGYTNVQEMLDKENLYEVYGALRFAEEGEWLNEFNQQYKRLTPGDFETREIKLVIMPKKTWGDVAEHFVQKKRHLNTHLKELGVVLILPSPTPRMPGIATKLISLTLHYYNEVRLYSSYFKSLIGKPKFGEIFVDTLIADPGNHAVLAGQNVHWRVIQRYFGKLGDEYHPEVFEPHVQPEDLHWRKAESLMAQIDPVFEFWQDLDYVGRIYDERPLTLNFIDVTLSYSNNIGYDERYVYHFRESLWNEIFMRYMGEKTLNQQILKQLDNESIAPEKLEN